MNQSVPTAASGRPRPIWRRIIWLNVAGLLLMHAGAVASLFFFSWPAFWLAVGLAIFTCQFGITLGYHRLLAHRSYRVPKWLERTLSWVGCMAFQTGPISWVATHRLHHQHSDQEQDPHSPHRGFTWAHVGWTIFYQDALAPTGVKRLCPDLFRDGWHRLLDRYFVVLNLALAAVLYFIGWSLGGVEFGIGFLLWGFCLRVVFIWHVTFLVNSASHVWGYQRYETGDDSRNNWWVALLTFGEGWHNNHHADQRCAAHGRAWWEIDTTYWIIQGLARLGLAKEVVKPSARAPRGLRPHNADECP